MYQHSFFKEISMRIQPDCRNFSHWHYFQMFFPCTKLHRTHHPNPCYQSCLRCWPWWNFRQDQLTNQGVWIRSMTEPKLAKNQAGAFCIHERYWKIHPGQQRWWNWRNESGTNWLGKLKCPFNNINEIFRQITIKCQTDVQEMSLEQVNIYIYKKETRNIYIHVNMCFLKYKDISKYDMSVFIYIYIYEK